MSVSDPTQLHRGTQQILVISRHQKFVTGVQEQFSGEDASVHVVEPDPQIDVGRLADLLPDVAFVDYFAEAAKSRPFHRSLAEAAPKTQIVLVCEPSEANDAANLVRLWEVFDYVLVDAVQDPCRLPLLVTNATTSTVADVAEIRGFAKAQHRRILDKLRELHAIMKSDGESPVLQAIRDHRLSGSVSDFCGDASGVALADEYQHCLVDLICGRLRRIERELALTEDNSGTPALSSSGGPILIVEDDVICAELAKHALEQDGFDIIIARNGEEAKLAMLKHHPSLVLMDIHLDDANGLHLARMIRRNQQFAAVPVIVMTADRNRTTFGLAKGLEIQGYLLKPFKPRDLVTKVRALLASSG